MKLMTTVIAGLMVMLIPLSVVDAQQGQGGGGPGHGMGRGFRGGQGKRIGPGFQGGKGPGFHGDATHLVLNADAYAEKFKTKGNPNLDLLHELHEAGVELYVCGQTLISIGSQPEEVVVCGYRGIRVDGSREFAS